MPTNLKQAIIFGAGLAIGYALGNAGLNWAKNTFA